MSENDSQRPQDVGNAGETQQQPRVQVESTCRRQQHSLRAGLRYADRQAAGRPTGREQAHGVKAKTKKLPIFITALAGCACGALLVIALIMSGTLDIGGGKNAVTAGASGSSTQKITIDSEDTTLAEAVSAKALPLWFPSPPLRAVARMARFRSLPTSRTTRAASVRAWCSIPRATSSPTTTCRWLRSVRGDHG